jgi:transcriptional regulator with XRE-family HTH domain
MESLPPHFIDGIGSDTIWLMDAGALIRRARSGAGFSLRHLAELAGTSHATLSAYESDRVNPSMQTVQRIIRAAGFGLTIDLVPLVGDTGSSRGDELLQVLELAAAFPARHGRKLKYPRFGEHDQSR